MSLVVHFFGTQCSLRYVTVTHDAPQEDIKG